MVIGTHHPRPNQNAGQQLEGDQAVTTLNTGEARANPSPRVLCSLAVGALPYIWTVYVWLTTPGYIVPFLMNRICCTTMVALAVWGVLGTLLLIREARKGSNALFVVKSIGVFTVFGVPLILCPLCGNEIFAIYRWLVPHL